MIGARWAWLGMHSTIYANKCRRTLTVEIADAMICLVQDEAKCSAWARLTECTNGLHALNFFAMSPSRAAKERCSIGPLSDNEDI